MNPIEPNEVTLEIGLKLYQERAGYEFIKRMQEEGAIFKQEIDLKDITDANVD